jgi:prevent-host-death family protein
MPTVNITELKNNLSHYLRQVRQGKEITIKDRNRVFARIMPAASSADYDEELLELAAQGKVKLPEQRLDPNLWRKLKPAKLKTKRRKLKPPEIPPTARDLAKELKRRLPRMKSKGEKAEQIMKRIWEEERGEY